MKDSWRRWWEGGRRRIERELELKGQHEQITKETVDKYHGTNLYIKNLDDSVGDEELMELFSEFGTITSCKVCEYGSSFCSYLQLSNLHLRKMCFFLSSQNVFLFS